MNLGNYINALTCTCFFHLRSIAKLWFIVSHYELTSCYPHFISSQLLLQVSFQVSQQNLNKASPWNAAARQGTKSNKYCHITPMLASLHWVHVSYEIFKVLVLKYRTLYIQTPECLPELLHVPLLAAPCTQVYHPESVGCASYQAPN